MRGNSFYATVIKPILDVTCAFVLLVMAVPVLIVGILSLTIHFGGNPFFVQTRPGKNQKLFKVIKLKTMLDTRDESGELLPDSERLTRLGKLIRKLSIDELPQLINVIKGEMSFVGPRPLLVDYLSLYNDEQMKRHLVRPGITGWAQVNGRNNTTWEKRFELDVFYVNHLSFALDVKILLKTVINVVNAKDVNEEGQATMTRFLGN